MTCSLQSVVEYRPVKSPWSSNRRIALILACGSEPVNFERAYRAYLGEIGHVWSVRARRFTVVVGWLTRRSVGCVF